MSAYDVTSSSELMQNYIQSDILQPQKKFIALQTESGTSLLFSVGTDDAFYVTKELPGVTHGWGRADLSSAQVKSDFSGNAVCKTFAAAQAAAPRSQASIHLAMVLNDGTNDHLYLSLANSDADTSWTDTPAWTRCPFNAKDGSGAPITPPTPFKIAGVLISEATDKEYIVVDIIRNPADQVGLVSRFYIDVTDPAAPLWAPHDLSIDLDAGSYSSCLGRARHAFGVDGLYTMGSIAGAPQLVYTPLYNVFDPGVPPAPARLTLPDGASAEAIAACRNADNSSDLYVIAKTSLYYFASANQKDEAVGTLLASHDILAGVRALYAYAADGNVTLWGLNGSDEVFYLTCAQTRITAGGAWSLPIAILTGVDAISPYVDRAYSANTFFAHGADGLVKAVKTPSTGIWSRRDITLPPSDRQQSARRISSYTTRIQVNDANRQAAPNVSVALSATSVTSVYINHLYYVIGPQPIHVVTDSLGSITIVELAQTLAGTRFTATVDAAPLAINPMDAPFQRSAALDSVAKLKGAVITNRDGSTRPFIPMGTSDDALGAVAQSNQDLGKAYAKLAAPARPQARRRLRAPRWPPPCRMWPTASWPMSATSSAG